MNLLLNIATIIALTISAQLMAENYCGNLIVPYGPFDYTNLDHRENRLEIVEVYHFTKDIEQLIPKLGTGTIGAELAYTLRAFPNHHRALVAMSKLGLRDKTNHPVGSSHSILCFFDRATRFKPDDAAVRAIFSGHLFKVGQFNMALEQLIIATELEPNNPVYYYNLGLLYFDKKDYAQAKKYAVKAYSQDFPLPGLRNKLINKGKWGN